MTLEQLLTETLHGADDFVPSPDLFAKVQRSIEEDATHRRRVRRGLLWTALGLASAMAWVIGFIDVANGTVTMPWWTIEVLTAAILMVLVLVLGPVIRRFGRVLTKEVFGGSEEAGNRFLALLDIAYYLIFMAFILMSTSFAPLPDWNGNLAQQVEDELTRVGGLLLFMGVLHAITIAVLPVMRLMLASNWRRAARAGLGREAPAPNPQAVKADRVSTLIVWGVAAVMAVPAGFFMLLAVLGLIFGTE